VEIGNFCGENGLRVNFSVRWILGFGVWGLGFWLLALLDERVHDLQFPLVFFFRVVPAFAVGISFHAGNIA
jgi:hypothetical protein